MNVYKIFIDTNIFLDFYRINSNDNINEILREINKYKRFFINTEQSRDEFMRNRERTIEEFVKNLNSQKYQVFNNNFIATFDEYDDYSDAVKSANKFVKIITDKCKNLIDNVEIDPIYNVYSNSYLENNFYKRTDRIVESAIKRKFIGNPPVSNKNTCCDEIIWETLLEYCDDDLIIVSRDETFHKNSRFLKDEYMQKKNKILQVVSTISEAINLNDEEPSRELENIENDIMIEVDLTKYGYLSDSSNWVNIIYNSLLALGGEAKLCDIYRMVNEVIINKYPEKKNNREKEATIRGILQRYSDVRNSEYSFFTQVERGKWALVNRD